MTSISAPVPFILKGTGYGIKLIISEDAPDTKIISELRKLPKQSFALATGVGIVIDLQSRQCSGSLISDLFKELAWNRNLNLLSWNSNNPKTLYKLKSAKLPVGEYSPAPEDKTEEKIERKNEIMLPPLLRHRSLRSGEKMEYNGDVVIFGHVNSGAEIIASGNISIFGKLKGLAHAGFNIQEGNEAYIFAYSFEPQQIRLGNLMNSRIGPQMPWWGKSVVIFMEKGSLIIREL